MGQHSLIAVRIQRTHPERLITSDYRIVFTVCHEPITLLRIVVHGTAAVAKVKVGRLASPSRNGKRSWSVLSRRSRFPRAINEVALWFLLKGKIADVTVQWDHGGLEIAPISLDNSSAFEHSTSWRRESDITGRHTGADKSGHCLFQVCLFRSGVLGSAYGLTIGCRIGIRVKRKPKWQHFRTISAGRCGFC